MESKKKLIDAQDAVRLLRGKCVSKYPNSFLLGLLAAASEIEGMPEAEPVVHGRWERMEVQVAPFDVTQVLVCTNCGFAHDHDAWFNRCPNCGAKMDLED